MGWRRVHDRVGCEVGWGGVGSDLIGAERKRGKLAACEVYAMHGGSTYRVHMRGIRAWFSFRSLLIF